jgi:DNA-binding CsgD family transcriptional regulator
VRADVDPAALDVVYRLDLDADRWLRAVAHAVWGVFDELPGVLVREVRCSGEAATRPRVIRAHCAGDVECAGGLGCAGDGGGRGHMRTLCTVPLEDRALAISIPASGGAGAESPDPVLATRIGEHIEAAARARRFLSEQPDAAPLVLSAEGSPQYADGTPVADGLRAALTRAVITTEHARGCAEEFQIRDPGLLWEDILDEGWQLVHHTDVDGRRLILGVRRTEEAGSSAGDAHGDERAAGAPGSAGDARGTRAAGGPSLTPREREVVTFASRGASNKEIAYELGLALSTVATHLRHGLEKLHVASRRELIALRRSITGLFG